MKDCAIICCFNSGTSLIGGVVIFSVLGYMAHMSGLNVEDVAEKGPGELFTTYVLRIHEFTISLILCLLFRIGLCSLPNSCGFDALCR